jgi:hypothetical protein
VWLNCDTAGSTVLAVRLPAGAVCIPPEARYHRPAGKIVVLF